MNNIMLKTVKIVILATLFPVAISILLLQALPEWKLEQIPLHSVFETLGLFAGLFCAILLMLLQKYVKHASHYVGVSTALICMGILDGFHAAVPAGNAFVWLHGMAVLSGGFLFAILWFNGNDAQTDKIYVLPTLVTIYATGVGVLPVLLPGSEPQMLREGAFTPWAISLNVVGGFLFVSASIYFLRRYYNFQKTEDILFTAFCYLNGLAGLFFWFSKVWDAEWWFWHLLRVLAYFGLLWHILIIFLRTETELREKTGELIEAQEELVRREKLSILGQLSGSVGHELRNPLGVMGNAVYFLKTVLADADDSVKEYLEMIKHEIDNSNRIINDLLDFARTKTPQVKSVTVGELVEQSLGRCAIPENVAFASEVPETLPQVSVDPLQVGQVLQNLITNAVQAMPDGGTLTVSARQVPGARSEEEKQLRGTRYEEEKQERGARNEERGKPQSSNFEPDADFVEISVEDTGEGIAPENMKKLFQPLFTTKPGGIGLGLVVCRNLMEANGGRIGVASESGEGTTFTVTVPVEQAEG